MTKVTRFIERIGKLCASLSFKVVWDFDPLFISFLAEQAWRILNDPSSLISKLCKGHYFLNTSFRLAKVGRCSIMAWCGIVLGLNLLEKGIRWKIVSGQAINITTEP